MTTVCETYRDDLVAEACGALPAEESKAVVEHVVGCPACREALARLREALEPLAAYEVDPPPRLIEHTQRHVARHMTMRLPRGTLLSRHRSVRLACAAAVLLCLAAALLLSTLPKTTSPTAAAEARFVGLWQAFGEYARKNGDHLPPEKGWFQAIRPFWKAIEPGETAAWPDELIFMEGLSLWTAGIEPESVLVIDPRPGPDSRCAALLRNGQVKHLKEVEAQRLLSVYRAATRPRSR
jgi:hypothetical protein